MDLTWSSVTQQHSLWHYCSHRIIEVNKCKFHTAITVSIYHRDVVLSLQCPRSSVATMTGWWRVAALPVLDACRKQIWRTTTWNSAESMAFILRAHLAFIQAKQWYADDDDGRERYADAYLQKFLPDWDNQKYLCVVPCKSSSLWHWLRRTLCTTLRQMFKLLGNEHTAYDTYKFFMTVFT